MAGEAGASQNVVEAVIWDFGGVFTSSPFEAFNRYEAERGLPSDFIRTVNATNPLHNAWALFERAEITPAAFDAKFAEESAALGHPVRGAAVLPLLSGDFRPRVIAALRTCKAAGLKVGCITNNVQTGHGAGMSGTPEKASTAAAVMALFDAVIESSKAGVRKPDPRIYQMMCETLGVAPGACVYLDDLGINCKPAAALGMTAIKVSGEEQLLADLAAATGLRFDPPSSEAGGLSAKRTGGPSGGPEYAPPPSSAAQPTPPPLRGRGEDP